LIYTLDKTPPIFRWKQAAPIRYRPTDRSHCFPFNYSGTALPTDFKFYSTNSLADGLKKRPAYIHYRTFAPRFLWPRRPSCHRVIGLLSSRLVCWVAPAL